MGEASDLQGSSNPWGSEMAPTYRLYTVGLPFPQWAGDAALHHHCHWLSKVTFLALGKTQAEDMAGVSVWPWAATPPKCPGL